MVRVVKNPMMREEKNQPIQENPIQVRKVDTITLKKMLKIKKDVKRLKQKTL
jgi:hypothetical protein